MKKAFLLLIASFLIISCNNTSQEGKSRVGNNEALAKLFDNYWEERLQLFPLEVTAIGDSRYNDKLTITSAESFRDSLKRFYQRYLGEISKIDSTSLAPAEEMSYSLFRYEMNM